MRSTFFFAASVLLIAGCQSAGTGGTPANGAGASQQPAPQAGPLTPISQVGDADKLSWNPDWWFDDATQTTGGNVQACGFATSPRLIEARRQAIDNARNSAMTLADAGQSERVLQAVSNLGTDDGFTVWVVLEVGGQ